ncbi:diphthine--ammonia ligase [Marivirga harenae]|uniref:Dph6-related ATP pyrophosphatase n=1 Tax=Marivirga harenae TaxID=2010992 RepID=UPI0026E04D16|nr:diphthine--ammonia ligase [Marivirga harenae]WKV10536.1 diphthine--ammonia ligase [Marivirga harenae]
MKKKIAISWSGGKDACLAFHYLKQSKEYKIDHLHTVIGEETNRVGMHGIKKELIEAQAKSLNLPLKISHLPSDKSNKSYDQVMSEYAEYCKTKGIDTIAFGDIFLEDLRQYREERMAETGMKCVFPLWGKGTKAVIEEFLDLGYQTKICAGDASKLNKSLIGQTINHQLIQNLGENVDPCGENGEFHTFVYNGPLFQNSIELQLLSIHSHFYVYKIEDDGKTKEMRTEFYFADFE